MDNIDTKTPEKRIPSAAAVMLGILAAVFAAIIPISPDGIIPLVIAVALEGLLLIAQPSFAAFLPIPAAYVIAVVLTGAPFFSLCALLFVPGAFCLRICFAKRCSLSVTLSALSVCFVLSYGIFLAAGLKAGYGSVVGGFNELKAQLSVYITKTIETINALAKTELPDGEQFLFTEDVIYLLKKELLMLSPAMIVVFCEIAAYISEKLMRLFSRIFRCPFVAERKEKVTLSAGFGVIFIISYVISTFAAGDNVVYYCAESIMLIVLPYASVAGMHGMFGEDGLFRTAGRTGFKVVTVLICIMTFLSSPVMLFALLALWGSVSAVSRAVFHKILELRADDGNDRDDGDDEDGEGE